MTSYKNKFSAVSLEHVDYHGSLTLPLLCSSYFVFLPLHPLYFPPSVHTICRVNGSLPVYVSFKFNRSCVCEILQTIFLRYVEGDSEWEIRKQCPFHSLTRKYLRKGMNPPSLIYGLNSDIRILKNDCYSKKNVILQSRLCFSFK